LGFGIFSRLKMADTDAEIESGFKIVPSGFANIRALAHADLVVALCIASAQTRYPTVLR
jgi:hypothetical protein